MGQRNVFCEIETVTRYSTSIFQCIMRIFTVTGILSILFSLAFKTRYTLPLLISAGFMVLDYQLTIEVEVEGNARDQPQPEERMARYASHYQFIMFYVKIYKIFP